MIEAMACGTPVVANNASSLPEVAGDAALLTDADDTEGFAAALKAILEDEAQRADLIARGFKRAAQFRQETCARRMLEIYADVVSEAAAPR
jgi:alpha-1,3-rhamnosyl/mannosyltransferase